MGPVPRPWQGEANRETRLAQSGVSPPILLRVPVRPAILPLLECREVREIRRVAGEQCLPLDHDDRERSSHIALSRTVLVSPLCAHSFVPSLDSAGRGPAILIQAPCKTWQRSYLALPKPASRTHRNECSKGWISHEGSRAIQ